MSTSNPSIPQNVSFLQPTKFKFVIPNLPFGTYFCQLVAIPVSTSPPMQANPFSDIWRHGVKIAYEPLNLSFLVDEDLRSWEETYKWLVSTAEPTKFEEYAKFYNKDNPIYFDGVLTLNTNANNPNVRVKFHNCHPISLSGIQFSTMESAENVLTAELSIRYDYYDIERI